MIEFQHVSKRYGRATPALHDITLSVARGELIFLAGPSGAGKSTLLKLIAAVERPSAGSLTVNGQDLGQLKPAGLPFLRRNLGLVLQQQRLLPDRSVLANVMLPLMVTGAASGEAEKRARAALDKVGLLDKATAAPLTLSGGEQQRAAIARAIVNRPQIILADEPTANLDRDSANLVLDALKTFHAAGVTCLISTHDEQFLDCANRVIYLRQGQIVESWRKETAATVTTVTTDFTEEAA
ncbi:cell division ATP-binding protein FtsE [Undibacterium arcticum]|uniref:Cell division ATP-binding protein FtsE n=1 Tax=Undibacterium arcticum TaxID=1762892 RepID=A0ABV7F0U7_9BURK